MANAPIQSLGRYALICLGIGGTAFWLGAHTMSSKAAKTGEIPVEAVHVRAISGTAATVTAQLRGFAAPRIDPEAPDDASVVPSAKPAAPASPLGRVTVPTPSLPVIASQRSTSPDASPPNLPADALTKHQPHRRTHRLRRNANIGADPAQRDNRNYRDVYDHEKAMHDDDKEARDNEQDVRGHYKDVYDTRYPTDNGESVRWPRNFDDPRGRYRVSDESHRRQGEGREGDRD